MAKGPWQFDRRSFLMAAGGGMTVGLPEALFAAAEGGRPRPNVVLVMTDDQGYGDLGCHGNAHIRTPHLDRLHGQTVRLTDFHVDPTCSPTRSALMTGRYSSRAGVWHTIMGRSLLRRDEVTMADLFAAGGYRTGIFGKWHLGDNYPFRPQDRGFQEVFIHGGGGVGQTPDYWGNDYFDDTYHHNGQVERCSGYCTDVWFDAAMAFIEANRDRPFFCYLPTNAPHGPYRVPEKYVELYRGNKDVPDAHFWGMITNIDENMGRLTAKLDALGLADDTILVFMTDNGTSGGFRRGVGFNAAMRAGKGSGYDGGHRVPCFIRWPAGGIQGGVDVDRLAAHVDLMPTLADLCGLQTPRDLPLDGTSLRPLLTGQGADWPDRTLFVHSQRIEHPQPWRTCSVMTQRWRLVNGRQLYDIAADPGQQRDLAPQHADIVNDLRTRYETWWADISSRFGEYCRIVVGSEHEPTSRITCHDWHGDQAPWDQSHIRKGLVANGFWAVEIERDGRYQIALRRWPIEAGDRPIEATGARLKLGDVDVTQPVEPAAAAATFTASLKAGKARLQTWLTDAQGTSRGAYYVTIKRLA